MRSVGPDTGSTPAVASNSLHCHDFVACGLPDPASLYTHANELERVPFIAGRYLVRGPSYQSYVSNSLHSLTGSRASAGPLSRVRRRGLVCKANDVATYSGTREKIRVFVVGR
jgi:hypothetical protein